MARVIDRLTSELDTDKYNYDAGNYLTKESWWLHDLVAGAGDLVYWGRIIVYYVILSLLGYF